MMELAIVFLASVCATVLSSMSGGGTGIIILPTFLALGIPYPVILATSNVDSAFWVLPAAYNYLKGRKIDWMFVFVFALIGLVGSYAGVLFVITLQQRTVELIAGTLILCLATYTLFHKGLGMTERREYSRARQLAAYPFALFLGFYENVFGAGNGIVFSLLTFYTKGFDFIDALGHYYLIAFFWCALGAALLIQKGYYDIPIMVAATIGSILGAYIGSRYGRFKGNKFIRMVFVAIGYILGMKLLLGL